MLNDPKRGQMAITMVIVVLLFLLLMFPIINMFVQNEGKWSVQEKKSTAAFHLAEAGVDRARWKLLENADMWNMVSTGTLPGYNFDKVYSDVGGGTYAISITSDPVDADKRIVESVGRDASGKEVRRIKAVLLNNASADFATRAVNQVSNTGNAHIEWGPVYSGNSIVATGMTYPRYYSAGHVSTQDGGSTSAATDNVYWWSYYAIPPQPQVKFSFYIDSATLSGPSPCGGNYFDNSGVTRVFQGCNDLSGKPYYITGDILFKAGNPGNHIRGTVITRGSITFQGNGGSNSANGTYNAKIPPEAWKEYGNAWATYRGYDAAAPATYAAAVSSNYVATNKYWGLSGVLIHGFIYAGAGEGLGGGGNGTLHGVLLVGNNATMTTSTFKLWYDDEVAAGIQLQGVNITMGAWYEVKGEWPAGL